jgi:predicted Zn finger-like uncharacterized protein
MRIVCPSCAAAYDVPESLLIGRKAVRCARCNGEWRPAGPLLPEPELVPAAVAVPDIVAPPRPVVETPLRLPRRDAGWGASAIDRLMATPQPKPRPNVALMAAWIVSLAAVAALLVAAYVARSEVMAVWPPSIRLYAALGLAGTIP